MPQRTRMGSQRATATWVCGRLTVLRSEETLFRCSNPCELDDHVQPSPLTGIMAVDDCFFELFGENACAVLRVFTGKMDCKWSVRCCAGMVGCPEWLANSCLYTSHQLMSRSLFLARLCQTCLYNFITFHHDVHHDFMLTTKEPLPQYPFAELAFRRGVLSSSFEES